MDATSNEKPRNRQINKQKSNRQQTFKKMLVANSMGVSFQVLSLTLRSRNNYWMKRWLLVIMAFCRHKRYRSIGRVQKPCACIQNCWIQELTWCPARKRGWKSPPQNHSYPAMYLVKESYIYRVAKKGEVNRTICQSKLEIWELSKLLYTTNTCVFPCGMQKKRMKWNRACQKDFSGETERYTTNKWSYASSHDRPFCLWMEWVEWPAEKLVRHVVIGYKVESKWTCKKSAKQKFWGAGEDNKCSV